VCERDAETGADLGGGKRTGAGACWREWGQGHGGGGSRSGNEMLSDAGGRDGASLAITVVLFHTEHAGDVS